MKYKVGDRVRIRNDLVSDMKYNGLTFAEEMECYKGKILTIADIDGDGDYRMKEEFQWYWCDEMIEGLVEPIKTNLDHYAKDILDYMYNSTCDKDVCNGCQICGICDTFVSKVGSITEIRSKDFVEWLKEEYKKPIQMTLFERSVLERAIAHGYKYIARDYYDDMLSVHECMPRKEDEAWVNGGDENPLDLFNDKFLFVKWEDKEPYDIQWLLDNCEVKE